MSLPVLSVGNAARVLKNYRYRRLAAESLIEFLFDIDTYRGSGRLYLPRSNE